MAAALAVAGLAAPAPAVAAPAPAVTAPPPAVTAPQAILVEPLTGEVVFSRAPHAARPVASTTKLMTALIVLDRVSLDDTFTATAYRPSSPAETRLGLVPGERMKVRDLLRALLLSSANDAAQTLAQGTAGSADAFVALMNERALSLGLRDTHYANPIGLDDPGNYSSAADLVKLVLRLRENNFFSRTVALKRASLGSGSRPRVVDNRNDLVGRRPWVNGVKTGHTAAAGYVLVGSASRSGVSVVSAVLGDPSEAARDADTVSLLEYGLAQFWAVPVLRRDRPVASAAVRHREEDRVALVPSRGVTRVLRRGRRAAVAVVAPSTLEGPIPAGARVGTAIVRVQGRVVDRVALLTATPVPAVSLPERALGAVLQPGTLAVVALAAVAAALVATGRRRRTRAGPS